jgi:hypothetical protein
MSTGAPAEWRHLLSNTAYKNPLSSLILENETIEVYDLFDLFCLYCTHVCVLYFKCVCVCVCVFKKYSLISKSWKLKKLKAEIFIVLCSILIEFVVILCCFLL